MQFIALVNLYWEKLYPMFGVPHEAPSWHQAQPFPIKTSWQENSILLPHIINYMKRLTKRNFYDDTIKSTFKEKRNAVKILVCMACCLEDLACRMHSAKWASNWLRCFNATNGKTVPNNLMDPSMTATPNGRGPGTSSPFEAKESS